MTSDEALAVNAEKAREAENEVRRLDLLVREAKAKKRAAAAFVDRLAVEREAILRGDPTRKRMTIGQ